MNIKEIKSNTCSFIGHRTINETEELKTQLFEIIEKLIVERKVDTFLFGSKSKFDDLCYSAVTKIKEKYPHIKRIYVRAEYPYINENYEDYLLEKYEYTYYPEKLLGAHKAVYLKRNFEMIEKSDVCVIYYQEDYSPKNRKSGTALALSYALKKNKKIVRLPLSI